MAILPNTYGYFSDDGKEYIITQPDTPMPWVNVISNGDYGLVVSQAGSGYSWRTHASMNRITRWEQDLIRDNWGKYLYLRDADTGDYWSAAYQPCKTSRDQYQVRHGMGYSAIETCQADIESEITYFVPNDDPCELWLFRLHNNSEQTRHLQLFTYFEWLLGAAPDWNREFHRLFIDTNFETAYGALLASKVLWDVPGTHWNQSWPYVAFHSSSLMPTGFDSDKRAFLGRNGELPDPHALLEGCSYNTQGRWGDAIGSLQVEVTLAPHESTEIIFVVGAADNTEQALVLVERYKNPVVAREALESVKKSWHEITNRIEIETPDPALNLMANGWLQYQAISCRLWARTAYYQTGGGYGFRDQLQDSLIWLLLDCPEKTLDQIRLHAAHQYQQGIVLHWWHPLVEEGLRSAFSDDLLWLPFVVMHYLQETGDFDCLQEDIPFFDEGSATLLEHCLLSFRVALSRRSERGLPLILEADWNDGLNAVGAAEQGESIWMGHFLYYLLNGWCNLAILDDGITQQFAVESQAIADAVNTHGWDGEWYWRATTDSGAVLGSAQSPEGQIFLNAQTWAVLSNMASDERARKSMASAREHLYAEYGPLLLAPGYTQTNPEIGYLSRYAAGARENGGVYVHAACWAIMAERQLNGSNSAYEVWRSFCPPLRGQDPDRYSAEPYVMPGNVSGPQTDNPGQGAWTWYTGSAAWYLRALIEGVLGVEACLPGLRIQADLPDGWDEFRLKRHFRGAQYDIRVQRTENDQASYCTVNGERWTEEFLPIADPGTVQVIKIWA